MENRTIEIWVEWMAYCNEGKLVTQKDLRSGIKSWINDQSDDFAPLTEAEIEEVARTYEARYGFRMDGLSEVA